MNQFERTHRKEIDVQYYTTHRKAKKEKSIKAQLYYRCLNGFREKIEGAGASYTIQEHESESEAKKVALSRAMQKLDGLAGRQHNNETSQEQKESRYFSKHWRNLGSKQASLVSDTHRPGEEGKVISLFESRLLPILDEYGADVTVDECREISARLYAKMLENKKFGRNLINKEDIIQIPKLFEELQARLALQNSEEKNRAIAKLLQDTKTQVVEEDRLRSRLENYLLQRVENGRIEDDVERVCNDPELCALIAKRDLTGKESANGRLIFLLREISGNELESKNQTNRQIEDFNAILRNWAQEDSENIRYIILPKFDVARGEQSELCKEWPWKVRIRYTAIEMYKADSDPYAAGAVVMATSGPRNAELCAIRLEDIDDHGDYGIVLIHYTTDGRIVEKNGKNIHFFRIILLPKFAMAAVRKHIDYVKKRLAEQDCKEGAEPQISEERLGKAYLVCSPNDPLQTANPSAFAAAVRRDLRIAGLDDEYWASVRNDMEEWPDLDWQKNKEQFDVAYSARRDAISAMTNIAKISPWQVDALVGHRIPETEQEYKKKLTRDDDNRKLAAQMERVIYDPRYSAHPVCRPWQIDEHAVPFTAPTQYQVCKIQASEDKICVKVKVQTVKCENVSVIMPDNACVRVERMSSIPGTDRKAQYFSECNHTPDEYRETIEQAIRDYLKEAGEHGENQE